MEDEKKTECIKNTLRLKGVLTEMKTVIEKIVDQDSLMDCMAKIEYLVEDNSEAEYIVNITGGTKIMALAAYEIFREIGQKVVIGYSPLGKNEFIQIFPRKRPLKVYEIGERLNLEEYLCGYGFRVQNKDTLNMIKDSTLTRKKDSEWILTH